MTEEFKEMEDRTGRALVFHEELVKKIATDLQTNAVKVGGALYATCIAIGVRPVEAAVLINEFLTSLREQGREVPHDEPR